MCDIVTIGVITAMASTGASMNAQSNQAKMQRKAQERATADENTRFNQQMTAQRAKEAQEAQVASSQIREVITKTRVAKGRARVSAEESGVTGQVVDQLMSAYERQEAESLFAIQTQTGFRGVNTLLQDEQASFASQQRLVGIDKPIAGVDYLGAAANLAGAGMSIYRGYQDDRLKESQLELSAAKIKSLEGA